MMSRDNTSLENPLTSKIIQYPCESRTVQQISQHDQSELQYIRSFPLFDQTQHELSILLSILQRYSLSSDASTFVTISIRLSRLCLSIVFTVLTSLSSITPDRCCASHEIGLARIFDSNSSRKSEYISPIPAAVVRTIDIEVVALQIREVLLISILTKLISSWRRSLGWLFLQPNSWVKRQGSQQIWT
jgi:hypothetical protein